MATVECLPADNLPPSPPVEQEVIPAALEQHITIVEGVVNELHTMIQLQAREIEEMRREREE
jgi:hypothetical protein